MLFLQQKNQNKNVVLLIQTTRQLLTTLLLPWVFKVLKKKGLKQSVIDCLYNIYEDNLSVVVVNNIEGQCFKNNRMSLRQGDVPSMFFFAYGIDPLISYLDKRLQGIPIYSLPVLYMDQ